MFIYFLLLLAKSPAIKIGVQFPLSGPISDYGIYCLQGVKLAFSDHPEISLVVRDNEGKAEICTEILHEFAGMGVCAVIGPVISPNAIIVGLEATKFGIPIILPAATNTAVTKVSDFLFRVCYTDEQQAEAIAKFTFFTLKRSKVAIISDTSNIYSIGLALYFRYYFESIGGKAHIIKWNGTSNLSDTLQNLIGSTIFLPLYYKPASDIIKLANEKGLGITFVGADGLDAPDLLKSLEQDTEKIYFSTHYFESEPTKLTTLYKKTYGGEVNTFVALGFDAANLLLLTIQQAKGISPVDIFHSLLNIQTFNGVTGDFTYQGRKDPLKSIFILQLQRGKLSLVQKL